MKLKITTLLLILTYFSSYAQNKLSVDNIMQDPKWMGTSPSNIFWSNDSKKIYFSWNPDKNLGDSLYSFDLITTKTIKVEPKAQYELNTREGIYNLDRSKMAYVAHGDLFVFYTKTQIAKQLTQTIDIEANPQFSLDQQSIIFQKSNNLYSINLDNGLLKQLSDFETGSKKAEKKKPEIETWLETDQMAMFEVLKDRDEKEKAAKANKYKALIPKKIYLNENRISGMSASPGLEFVAYNTIETAKTAKTTLVPSYVTKSGYTEELPARTKVGTAQSEIKSFIYDVKNDTVWTIDFSKLPGIKDRPKFMDEYSKVDSTKKVTDRKVSLSEYTWSPLGTKLIAVVRSQDNKDRWIVSVNPSNGKLESLNRQHDEAWIAGPGIGSSFGGGSIGWINESTFYFQSEETGYSHLYTYDIISKKKEQLTSGNYEVLNCKLSKDKKRFFLTTNAEHPGEQHFYHLNIDNKILVKITTQVGAHDVEVSPDEQSLAIRYSYINKPWELYIQKNEAGSLATKVTESLTKEFTSYPWKDAKVISFKATDGQEIYARIYEPAKKNKKAVIFVHGAGYLQNAHKWWSNYFREYMFHNLLVDLGYTVLDIDYRASAGYGREVRTGIYRHMGGKDLTDNVDGAKLLVEKYGIDKNKIGIYGGSYGGFITLMALFTTPDVFKAGAALRPVTDWAAYNQGYTSNILNEPQTDSLAYRRSSPVYFAEGLKNNLLICHGMVDVNVHYQDAVRLTQRLIELKKENWELASYPMEDHGFVEPSSWTDEYKRILKLFEEKLK